MATVGAGSRYAAGRANMRRRALSNGDWIRAAGNAAVFIRTRHGAAAKGCNHEVMSGWAGKVNSKVAPRGTFALAHNRPPCASMIERQIDSPIPKPPGFVV